MEMTVVGAVLVVCMLLMLTSGIWVALTLTGLAIIGLALIANSSIGLLLGILAAITMTIGNLAALRQSSLKRMLAYLEANPEVGALAPRILGPDCREQIAIQHFP